MAKTVSFHRLAVAAFLMAVLLVGSRSAFAQVKSNLDYYVPRTTSNDIQHFNNVTNHHLPFGKTELANRRYDQAMAHAEFMLRYFPNHPDALTLLSDTCRAWKHPKCDAIADERFKKAIELNPNIGQTYLVHAVHLHRKGQIKDAVEAYRQALELAPESINVHYNLGLAYLDMKQYDLANQHAQKSYQLGASLPGLRNRLEKVGKWNVNVSMPVTAAKTSREAATTGESKSGSESKSDGSPAPQDQQVPAETVTK